MMMSTNHERIAARMIRVVMIAIVIVMGMMANHRTVRAQELTPSTPCDPCSLTDRTPWAAITEQSTVVTLGSGCSFTVYYKVRHCIDCYEVKVDRIVNSNPPACDWLTQEEVASLAIGFMLNNNLIGAPALPQPGEHGAKCLKIIKPRCWRKVVSPNDCPSYDGSYSPGTIVGCSSTDCCTNVLWVERDWCDGLRFLDLRATDYINKFHSAPGPAETAEEDAYRLWANQFLSWECEFCGPGSLTEVKCIFGCNESLLGRYNYLMQRFLQKLYKP